MSRSMTLMTIMGAEKEDMRGSSETKKNPQPGEDRLRVSALDQEIICPIAYWMVMCVGSRDRIRGLTRPVRVKA